ncbi:unnamed protein product [Brachionus calyciflorus]|uniref:DNAJC1 n=1 Tax=Brachionus calyciflorus TaxID=104777 RepID=A0A813M3B3_9BILA|nr:unnamed protein product [Brachionus calyciflorus]
MRFGNILAHCFSNIFVFYVFFSSFSIVVNCWESYELDLFDLVEEVNQNFYEFFGVSQNSDSNEIKRAYRKLSLQLHPDRNNEPDAETKFRFLVAINDVLKDEIKRARYDKILEHGLPDWRSPVYYFRRVRKLSLYELFTTLSVIITIGHYFVLWAQHFEKKLTLDDRISDIKKLIEKKQKKKKTSSELDEIDAKLQEMYDNLPSPKLTDTLPVKLLNWLFKKIRELPSTLKEIIQNRNKPVEEEVEEEEPVVKLKSNKSSKLHLDLNPKNIELASIKPVTQTAEILHDKKENNSEIVITSSKKEWSDKEKSDLIKAVAKFPAGSVNRWIKISELTGRSPAECIQMEKLMKTNIKEYSNLNLNASVLNNPKKVIEISEQPTSGETRTFETESKLNDQWSQAQQTLLEKALKEFDKDTPNRWDRITERVTGKTKEECINRYKALCAAVKKK